MTQNVVILGAGGKMGARASAKLAGLDAWHTVLVETNPDRAEALRHQGLEVTPIADGLAAADYVVMAVPDALIGRIAADCLPHMKPGSTLMMLDAAAAYIGDLTLRPGVTQMIAHPCHPPFFTEQPTPEARRDYFGGIAQQDLITALIEGGEEAFQHGVDLAAAIFAPIRNRFRVTAEQFALLEPAMSEMLVGTAATWMKAALEEAVHRGVPRDAAAAFMAGHAQIALAMAFGAEPSPFSDAALKAIEWGTQRYLQPDWRKAYDREELSAAIRFMLHSQP